MRADVLQPVMASAAATKLQLDAARWHIELVVRDQNFVRKDLEELRERDNRLPRAVHISLRLQQMHFFAVKPGLRVETVKAPLVAQCRTCFARQLIDQPEAGIVARRGVFSARIAEPDDQLDHDCIGPSGLGTERGRAEKNRKKTRRGEPRRVTSTVSLK